MKYNSIREYFYKFHNLLFTIILVPLLAFVLLYWMIQQGEVVGPMRDDEDVKQLLVIGFGAMACLDWLISFVFFNQGLHAARKLVSLGERLDKYYSISLVRFLIIISGSLGLAIGFYLTEDQRFTLFSGINLLLLLLVWPRSVKVCNDLQLRGDERKMIHQKKDLLY